MALDVSQAGVGEELVAQVPYIFRVTSAKVVASKGSGNLRMNVQAVVAAGASAGQSVSFKAFAFMLRDKAGNDAKTPQYIMNTRMLVARILGADVNSITLIPTAPGEVVPWMEDLVNSLFEAEADWQEPEGGYDGRWYVGRVIRPVAPEEIEAITTDWGEIFTYDTEA